MLSSFRARDLIPGDRIHRANGTLHVGPVVTNVVTTTGRQHILFDCTGCGRPHLATARPSDLVNAERTPR